MCTALDESKAEKTRNSLLGIVAKTGVYPGMAGIGRVKPEDGDGRRRRIVGKGNSSHCYHVMSRTCGGEVLFDEVEREALAKLLNKMAAFCGVELLTYCVMNNHFHALVRVPDREEWMARFDGPAGEKTLMRHLSRFYSRAFMMALETQLAEDRRLGNEAGAQERLNGFKRRLCDVSEYVREVKLRYSKWFNKRHGRKGTLWMERFKSVLVEGRRRRGSESGEGLDALRTMALYIDLNPVRAGIVGDPAEYRWSGYGAAVGGEAEARRGLCDVVSGRREGWKKSAEAYRMWLFDTGKREKEEAPEVIPEETSDEQAPRRRKTRGGVDPVKRSEVLSKRGKMSVGELIRHRVRYFSDGVVIGSREFVEAVFEANRDRFGPKRQTGARRIGESEEPFFSLRQLRRRPVG